MLNRPPSTVLAAPASSTGAPLSREWERTRARAKRTGATPQLVLTGRANSVRKLRSEGRSMTRKMLRSKTLDRENREWVVRTQRNRRRLRASISSPLAFACVSAVACGGNTATDSTVCGPGTMLEGGVCLPVASGSGAGGTASGSSTSASTTTGSGGVAVSSAVGAGGTSPSEDAGTGAGGVEGAVGGNGGLGSGGT